jgi:hypothetical protein
MQEFPFQNIMTIKAISVIFSNGGVYYFTLQYMGSNTNKLHYELVRQSLVTVTEYRTISCHKRSVLFAD